jgi:hypothetical protein
MALAIQGGDVEGVAAKIGPAYNIRLVYLHRGNFDLTFML